MVPGPHRTRLAVALLGTLVIADCQFDEQLIAPGRDRVVVHAVLNPGAALQVILLERTLSGRITISDSTGFDPGDPIVSGGGVPVTGARVVVVRLSTGDSVVVPELRALRDNQLQRTGAYTFTNGQMGFTTPFLRVVPGEGYRLRVVTALGERIDAETFIPSAPFVSRNSMGGTLNRDVDTLALAWSVVPHAQRYELRIETPAGPFGTFLEGTEYRIAGSLHNVDAARIPIVFFPGFSQSVSVGAVDANYYDYFRSANNAFSGSGLISHIRGGIGLFGSYVLIRSQLLDVTATMDEEIEQTWDLASESEPGSPRRMQLFVVDKTGDRTQLSGSYAPEGSNVAAGVIATLEGSHLSIAFLRRQLISDTALVMDGAFDGTQIDGIIRSTGASVLYTRAVPP